MNDVQFIPSEPENSVAIENEEVRKPYLKPYLQEMGDLRNLTLGPSPGPGESGNPTIFKT